MTGLPVDHLIRFENLIKGRLQTRYKRFFADIVLDSSEEVTAHCPNPGKMLGLLMPGTPALVTRITDPSRKLGYRLEALEADGVWVGVNTQWPNRLIARAIEADLIPQLKGYTNLKPEVRYGRNSRIDLFASGHTTRADAWIEVKNVHLSRTPGLAEFPDCVTERGAKHLLELIDRVHAGDRAVVVFCVQRDDVTTFDIARDCDPGFGRAYDQARVAGVEFIAVSWQVSEHGLRFAKDLVIQD